MLCKKFLEEAVIKCRCIKKIEHENFEVLNQNGFAGSLNTSAQLCCKDHPDFGGCNPDDGRCNTHCISGCEKGGFCKKVGGGHVCHCYCWFHLLPFFHSSFCPQCYDKWKLIIIKKDGNFIFVGANHTTNKLKWRWCDCLRFLNGFWVSQILSLYRGAWNFVEIMALMDLFSSTIIRVENETI